MDAARLISFDIFDTLLFRKTNTPETIFNLMGKHFHIHGFRKLRMDAQNEANRRVCSAQQAPHANIDEIYHVLSEHTEIPVDWDEVKEYEIQMERDALTANQEMLDVFLYAKAQGKRVVAVSDTYFSASVLSDILTEQGFAGIDCVYSSADEHKTKSGKELFELIAQREQVSYNDILHIDDAVGGDEEHPCGHEIRTYLYKREGDLEKVKDAAGSDVDFGLYKILYDAAKGFWYNLGVEVGGPIYMGLYQYLAKKAQAGNKKIYFLSRDGYNLYQLFKAYGFENVEYLYTSRRALTLAAIRQMDEQALESLPPYTYGQTVGEILDYLCVDRSQITHLEMTGLGSFDHVICSYEDIVAFKKLYLYDGDVFLRRCEQERENAIKYFNAIGFFDHDSICFDCGWQGSSQALIERFKKAVGCDAKNEFVYFGIKNCDKSRKQLRGLHYDTYLFDFYKNYTLQTDSVENVIMYELFFSAPEESVYFYDENGMPVFEDGSGSKEMEQLLAGVLDYVRCGLDFVRKYHVEYTPKLSVGHLTRLIHRPTEEEAVCIGNFRNVDGFARKKGEEQYVAWLTKEQLRANPKVELYWPNGLFARPDVPVEVKKICAARIGRPYPMVVPEYHLEDAVSLSIYHKWLNYQEKNKTPQKELSYQPFFSVVIPVYNTVTEQLEECIQSVLTQSYKNFELILVDDHSSWANVRPVLRKYESEHNVQVIYRETNGHISVATNDGIRAATGDFIVFMDCDDTIDPSALYEFAAKLNENPELDFIYSDEDKLTEDGKIRHMPFFKPEWSPDLFLTLMYTNHLAAYRASIVKEIGGLRSAYNGSQDYDFTLRFMEKSSHTRVGHVPRILYHWRERKESLAYAITAKDYVVEAVKNTKEDYIRRNGLNARVEDIPDISQCRIVYGVDGNPLVSVIIPSKDNPETLKQCIDSLRNFTCYQNYEIIVVDNGSLDQNRMRIEPYLSSVGAQYIYEKEEFNFSRMCNRGARHAKGEFLLFLNDGMEFFQSDWMERMLGQAQQKHTGAVGAKLLYPGTSVLQHMGVSNPQNGPMYSFIGQDDQFPCYFAWNRMDSNCIAVTGTCLMLAAEKFIEIGSFDEEYPVAYNDTKLCFALHRKGYYNVIRSDVVAYHHDSLSYGHAPVALKNQAQQQKTRQMLFAEFPELEGKDPYLNEHLRQWSAGLNLKHCNSDPGDLALFGGGLLPFLKKIYRKTEGWLSRHQSIPGALFALCVLQRVKNCKGYLKLLLGRAS